MKITLKKLVLALMFFFVFSNVHAEVKKFNMRYIPRIQKQFPNLEIIGGGGIYSPQDLLDYSRLGIHSFSLSTVFFNPWKVDKILKTADIIKTKK